MLNDHSKALSLVRSAKEFAANLAESVRTCTCMCVCRSSVLEKHLECILQESGFLSILCYNFATGCYNKQDFEMSVSWIRESIELGKTNPLVTSRSQVPCDVVIT